MGTIQIRKIARTVTVGKQGEKRQKVKKTYGKILYRGTLNLTDMAEHIMKHGSVYTEDVVIGVITKLKSCIQEMLADGYKVKLDGIGTLYPVLTSQGVADAKDFNAQENITRLGISFLADQSKKSAYKASAMRRVATLSTQLYSELTGEDEASPNPSEGGESNGGSTENGHTETTENNSGGGENTNPSNPTNPSSGDNGGGDNGGGSDQGSDGSDQ